MWVWTVLIHLYADFFPITTIGLDICGFHICRFSQSKWKTLFWSPLGWIWEWEELTVESKVIPAFLTMQRMGTHKPHVVQVSSVMNYPWKVIIHYQVGSTCFSMNQPLLSFSILGASIAPRILVHAHCSENTWLRHWSYYNLKCCLFPEIFHICMSKKVTMLISNV